MTATWANVATPTTTDSIAVATAGSLSILSQVYDSSCTATAGTTAKASGSCPVAMPTTAGSYVLELLASGTATVIVSSSPITLTAATKASPTLSAQASPGVTLGGSVYDTATLASGSSPTGSITFSLYGSADTTCSSPVTTSTITVNGNASYVAASFVPASPGTYLWVASYSGDAGNNGVSGTCGASGQSVTVGPAGPSLTISTTSTAKGSTVTVSWSGVPSPKITDWIGIFVPGAANSAYLSRIYDSSCSTFPFFSSAKASGSCSFKVPTTAGTYEFRLLASSGPTLLATSPQITVS